MNTRTDVWASGAPSRSTAPIAPSTGSSPTDPPNPSPIAASGWTGPPT